MKSRFVIAALVSFVWSCADDAQTATPNPDAASPDASIEGGATASTDAGLQDDAARQVDTDTLDSDASVGEEIETAIAAGDPSANTVSVSSVRLVEGRATSVDARAYVSLLAADDAAALPDGLLDVRPWYVWDDTSSIICGGAPGAYLFELEAITVDDESVARAEHRGAGRVAITPDAPGTTTLTITGRFSYNRERVPSPPGQGQDARCVQLWDAPVPAVVTVEVEVLTPNGLIFAVGSPIGDAQPSSGDPAPHAAPSVWAYAGCPGEAGGPVTIVEGRSARVGYTISAPRGPATGSTPANWTRSETMALRSHEGGPTIEVVRNQASVLTIRSTTGTGRASLDSPRGSAQSVDVVGPEAVASVEVFFFNGNSRLYGPDDPVYGVVNIGQGPFALRDGLETCNETLGYDARSLTPEHCAIGESFATRTSYTTTDRSVEFLAPGRCEVELSWPDTEIVQRHAFKVVEAPSF